MNGTTMSLEDIISKREELIRQQGAIQAQLSNLRLGGSRRLSRQELAQRERLAAEYQEVASDITILNKLRREANHARRSQDADSYIETKAIDAATDLIDTCKLVTGYIGDIHNLLITWRDNPPATVAECVEALAATLGENTDD
jgi:hypothetical protein